MKEALEVARTAPRLPDVDAAMFRWYRGKATQSEEHALIDAGYLRITNERFGHVAATKYGRRAFERGYKRFGEG